MTADKTEILKQIEILKQAWMKPEGVRGEEFSSALIHLFEMAKER